MWFKRLHWWISKCLHHVFNALVLISNVSPAFLWAFSVQNKTFSLVSQLSSNNIVFHHFFFLKWFPFIVYIIFCFLFVLYVCIVLLSVFFNFLVFFLLFEGYELCMFKCFSFLIFRFVLKCAHTQAALSSLDCICFMLLVICDRMQFVCVCDVNFHLWVVAHPIVFVWGFGYY